MKRLEKVKLILVIIFFLLLPFLFIFGIYHGFNYYLMCGSPISRIKAKYQIKNYLQNKYPSNHFDYQKLYYSFKEDKYTLFVKVSNESKYPYFFRVIKYDDRSDINDDYIGNYLCKDLRDNLIIQINNTTKFEIAYKDIEVETIKYKEKVITLKNYMELNKYDDLSLRIHLKLKGKNVSPKILYDKLLPLLSIINNMENYIERLHINYQSGDKYYYLDLKDNRILVNFNTFKNNLDRFDK